MSYNKCQYCKKCFNFYSSCKRHEQTHAREKCFKCKQCGKCFKLSHNLKQHEQIHTGEKPYTCQYCKKCFNVNSKCKQHERKMHTREEPTSLEHASTLVKTFTCWICQEEGFTSWACLIAHYDDHMKLS